MMKTFLTLLVALVLVATGAQAQDAVRLGQIVPLTGPLANVGKEINAATQAALAQHNASSRPKIELLTEDDGNSPERSATAVHTLSGKVSGLLSCFGTVGCVSQAKAAQPSGLPLIAPIAGAPQLRGKSAPWVFAVRASATEELARLLQYCKTVGLTKLAVAVQDDGFGQAYNAALQPFLASYGIEVADFATINPLNPDYATASAELQKSPAHALLLLANSTHSVGLLKTWREKGSLPFVLNLSGQANGFFANGLKGYSGAAAFVTATPSPWDKKLPLQRDYQAAMDEAGVSNLSYLSFEAYINTRIAIEAIKRSKDRSPAALKSAMERAPISVGGMEWRFGDQAGTRFTDLALLRADGTFKH